MNLFSNLILSILPFFSQTGGWTQFTPSTDTRIVYVSSSMGNDSNNGLSESTPKRTIDKGEDLIRQGYPDWLLLKAGDEWNESLGRWQKSGRLNEKILISYYGVGARPKLNTGSGGGIWTDNGGGSPVNIDNWAIVGLHFIPHTYNGTNRCAGITLNQSTKNFLLEDCVFERYSDNVVFMGIAGPLNNLAVKRCIFVDAYFLGNGHSQGMYIDNANGILLESNVLDHNGWQQNADSTATIFNHNIYIQNNCSSVIVIGNIITNAASHGIQLRCGGVANYNLFARNPIALQLGGGNSPNPGGVMVEAWSNVIIDGKNINANEPRGWGIILENVAGGNVCENIITTNTTGTYPHAMPINGVAANTVGVKNTNFVGNIIYNWGSGPFIQGNASRLSGQVWRKNHFQDHTSNKPLLDFTDVLTGNTVISRRNIFYRQGITNNWFKVANVDKSFTQWKSGFSDQNSAILDIHYLDPNRSIGRYNYTLGGSPTYDAFMQSARNRQLHTWPVELTAASVNDYIRNGFKQ